MLASACSSFPRSTGAGLPAVRSVNSYTLALYSRSSQATCGRQPDWGLLVARVGMKSPESLKLLGCHLTTAFSIDICVNICSTYCFDYPVHIVVSEVVPYSLGCEFK